MQTKSLLSVMLWLLLSGNAARATAASIFGDNNRRRELVGLRKYFAVVLALLLCQSTAYAKTQMGKPPHSAYAMRVDYNPKTRGLAGLFQINGHSCWLFLDTGWIGITLFTDHQSDLQSDNPTKRQTVPDKKQGQKNDMGVHIILGLGRIKLLQVTTHADINYKNQDRTSTNQPVVGIIGPPFLNTIPTEWNVPKHKIVFWLRGRPKQFLHVPPRAIIVCKRDREGHLLIPITVHGKHGEICFDTGADQMYVFDKLISNFPAVGPEGVATGLDLTIHCVPRKVEGLRVGPLTYNGIILGRLSASSLKETPFAYGSLGMSIISHLHLFVTGDKIIFDPHSAHFSSSQ